MSYDERKFAELVLYVADQLADDPAGGATKLNKALFFSEFAHVRAYGQPITGAEYQKLQRGPAPRRLLPVRTALIERGEAELEEVVYLGCVQKRLVPRRAPDLTIFSGDELKIVDQVIENLRSQSGTGVSSLSHREVGWQMVNEGETIPYEAAYLRPPVLTPAVERHAAVLAANRLP
jgi:hypothetical protein